MPIVTVKNPGVTPIEAVNVSNERAMIPASGSVTDDFNGAQLDMLKYFGDALNSPVTSASVPVNTVEPVITGTAQVGEELTSDNGTWTGTPAPTFTKQWLVNGNEIEGETGDTYTPVSNDIGLPISVAVTATNAAGSDVAVSDETAPVISAA